MDSQWPLWPADGTPAYPTKHLQRQKINHHFLDFKRDLKSQMHAYICLDKWTTLTTQEHPSDYFSLLQFSSPRYREAANYNLNHKVKYKKSRNKCVKHYLFNWNSSKISLNKIVNMKSKDDSSNVLTCCNLIHTTLTRQKYYSCYIIATDIQL